jgi:hypothetical protein
MASRYLSKLAGIAAVTCGLTGAAHAAEIPNYGFPAAAQEITQLFWLAETANACGWASADEASRFKSFSVRFLSAHLSAPNQLALMSLITERGYEDQLKRVALEGAHDNCGNRRWHLGWLSYKKAADENEAIF